MQEELLLSVFKKRFSIRIFFIKDFLLLINFSRRITPAYAGKTASSNLWPVQEFQPGHGAADAARPDLSGWTKGEYLCQEYQNQSL
ncbi:hypothetical protein [Pseudoramibacter alactolyticus]